MRPFVALGQSNSIIKTGFLHNIRQRDSINCLRSALLGASPSVIGPYFLDDEFFKGADYCVIDTCVVDSTAINNQATDFYQVSQWIEWIGHKCRINQCEPIFVLIPGQVQVKKENPISALYMSIINSARYYYLDVHELIVEQLREGKTQISSFFLDLAHIAPHVSARVADIICEFFARTETEVTTARQVSAYVRDFSTAELHTENLGATRVQYNNSLAAFCGVRLERNDRITLAPQQRTLKVHALYVNAVAARAKVRISGDVQIVKNMNLRPYSKTDFEARVVPVSTVVQDRDGKIAVEIVHLDEETDEKTMFESLEFDGPEFVEIGGVLLEHPGQIVEYEANIPLKSWDLYRITNMAR